MFTGIVTDVGRVRAFARNPAGARLEVFTTYDTDTIALGASIAHAGCCLTVVEKGVSWYAVQLSNETLDKTTLGSWREGDPINLERALKVGDELGGHVVAGHVDGVGQVVAVAADGDAWRLGFLAPEPLHRYIAPKGSITVDGVSLTVNEVEGQRFGVALIPHTWAHTSLHRLKPGAGVNLEIDLMARYAARWRETA